MELWHLFILGHVMFMPAGQYFGKIFVHKIHPYQILFYQYIASIITISIYLKLLRPHSGFFDIPLWFIVIGFMYAFGISATYHAKKQSLSKTSVLTKSTNFVAILLAIIFLNESQLLSLQGIGLKRLIGVVCIILSIILFYYKKTHRGSEKTFDHKIWIKWMSIYIAIMGFAKFIVKYAVDNNDPLLVLRLQYVGSFTVIALLCLFTKKSIRIGWRNIFGSMLIGVLISTSLALLYTALSLSSATQVYSIVTVAVVMVITLMGVLFFKEKITKRMVLPFLLGLISIYLLK